MGTVVGEQVSPYGPGTQVGGRGVGGNDGMLVGEQILPYGPGTQLGGRGVGDNDALFSPSHLKDSLLPSKRLF